MNEITIAAIQAAMELTKAEIAHGKIGSAEEREERFAKHYAVITKAIRENLVQNKSERRVQSSMA
jgi:hypothetical protein